MSAGIGHNSSGIAADQLRSFIERVERLDEERKAINADIKDVYLEAKAQGFDVKIMRKVVTLRKKDAEQRKEEEALLELYTDVLGM